MAAKYEVPHAAMTKSDIVDKTSLFASRPPNFTLESSNNLLKEINQYVLNKDKKDRLKRKQGK